MGVNIGGRMHGLWVVQAGQVSQYRCERVLEGIMVLMLQEWCFLNQTSARHKQKVIKENQSLLVVG